MKECLICKSKIEPFISFGPMPIANKFLTKEEFDSEYFFDLEVGFCSNCKMVQLLEQPKREMMFHEEYAFFSSTSIRMAEHFKKLAQNIMSNYLSSDGFVVELGSNDGIMLQNLAEAGIRHLGVEPSSNVAEVAIQKGINTISEFFDEKLAEKIIDENGHADAIFAANVMCHIPYLHSVFAGINKLLKPSGVFIFEDPYLGDIVEKTSYDQIYDEHAFYFSVASISYLCEEHCLEIVDLMPLDVHGGSMRYIISHKETNQVSTAVIEQRKKEEHIGLFSKQTFDTLRNKIEESRKNLVNLLIDLKKKGKSVVGYAATSKSTTITNYCKITPDLVAYISDTTPIKQGKYNPGTHIPIKPYEEFSGNYPDYALLFGWNHATEIMAKEKDFVESGGKWIVYVPEVKII